MRLVRAISRVSTVGPEPVRGLAHVQQHHDLLERGVPRALADPVDRALHLAAACPHAREGVGHSHAQVVVAVHRRGHLGQSRHEPVQLVPHLGVLVRHRVSDGVRHVDRRGALVERDLQHLGCERELRAGGVHRRELHVVAVRTRLRHGGARLALHVLARRLELVLDVDVARRDERVDARALGVLDRVPGSIDVLGVRARKPTDHRPVHVPRDGLHGLEVARRGDGEAGLDHVDPETSELMRNLELLLLVQRDPRRLLPVAQGRVEDLYSVLLTAVHVALFHFRPVPLRLRLQAAATLNSSPEGEKKRKSEAGQERHASKRTRPGEW